MPIRFGRRSCNIIGKVAVAWLLFSALASPVHAENVRAEDYSAFWLWAGVKPQKALGNAEELFLLAGEVRDNDKPHIISQRSATPHLNGPKVWIVYRAQTLAWDENIILDVLAHIETWREAGNNMAGLQIDFDAGTKSLARYATFLAEIRARLPEQYRLSITGLLDWSANGDPAGLDALAGVVDEVVLQIYQGRRVIPGYQSYLTKLATLAVPFRIGLLQGGEWDPPATLSKNPNFKGYVVFLLNNPT